MAGLFDDLIPMTKPPSDNLFDDLIPPSGSGAGAMPALFNDAPQPTISDSLKRGYLNTMAGHDFAQALDRQELAENVYDYRTMSGFQGGQGEAARSLGRNKIRPEHLGNLNDMSGQDWQSAKTTNVATRLLGFENQFINDRDALLASVLDRQDKIDTIPVHSGVKQFGETKGALGAIEHLVTNPSTAGHLLAESVYPMTEQLGAAALGGLVAGPAGMMLGTGKASNEVNFASKLLEEAQKTGLPLGDLIKDKNLRDKAAITAQKYAGPVSAADALSMGATRFLAPFKSPVANVALQGFGVQPALGAGGEAAGQLNAYGEIKSMPEVVAEGMLEIPGGMAEMGMTHAFKPKAAPDLATPSPNSLSGIIASGEGDYGSYNKGVAGDSRDQIDFTQMTVGELMARQALPKGDPNRIFAFGKYQAVPGTFAEAVQALGISPNERVTPELQERIFADYLVKNKRPPLRDYITGASDDIRAAVKAGAMEFASVANPDTGKSYHAGKGGNAASISAERFGDGLQAARSRYADLVAQGVDPSVAYRQSLGAVVNSASRITNPASTASPAPTVLPDDFNNPLLDEGFANALSDAEPVVLPDDFDETNLDREFDAEAEAASNDWDNYQNEIEQRTSVGGLFGDLLPDSLNTEQNPNAQNALESKISSVAIPQDTPESAALKSSPVETADEIPASDPYQGEKLVGQSSRIRSEDGQWHEVDYEVLDAARLNPTIEQADNQYRDRNRVALTQQVQSIGNDLQYELVGQSPVMDYGAPVLNQVGQIVAGNGRMSGIQEAYKTGKGTEYKAKLVQDAARLGLDPAQVQGMKYPVLVRRFKNAVNTRDLAVMSNEGGAARMSPLEQARVDAERVGSLHDLEFDDAGNITLPSARNLVRRILAKTPINQHNELMDAAGGISQAGLRRVQNAVLHMAYGDSPALQRLVERTDNTSRNVLNALNGAAPALAELRDNVQQGIAHPHLNIIPHLIDAVEIFTRLRSQGVNVQDWLNQLDAFNDTPIEIKQLLSFLDQKARRPATLRDFLQRYAEGVKQAGNPKQAGLFADNPPASSEVINNAIQQAQQTEAERNTNLSSESKYTRPSQDKNADPAITEQSSVSEDAKTSYGTNPVTDAQNDQINGRNQFDLFYNNKPVPNSEGATLVARASGSGSESDSIPTSAIINRANQNRVRGTFATRTKLIPHKRYQVGVSQLRTSSDVAHVFDVLLGDRAREALDVIVVDDNDQILAVQRMTTGTLDASSVYPEDIIRFVSSIPDAAQFYTGHNHPGGISTFSEADHRITQKIASYAQKMPFDFAGMFAIGKGEYSFMETAYGAITNSLPQLEPKYTIDLLEHVLDQRGTLGNAITDPESAAHAVKQFDDNGIVLLNTRNIPVAFYPFDFKQAEKLANNPEAVQLLAAVAKSNAAAAILKTEGITQEWVYIDNKLYKDASLDNELNEEDSMFLSLILGASRDPYQLQERLKTWNVEGTLKTWFDNNMHRISFRNGNDMAEKASNVSALLDKVGVRTLDHFAGGVSQAASRDLTVRSQDNLYSKTNNEATVLNPNYKAASGKVKVELSNKLGDATLRRLIDSGKLVISDNAPSGVAGVYQDGRVMLYPQNIPIGQAWAVFVHEAGEHAALSKMLGDEYTDLVKQFNQLLEKGNPEALKAAERVPASTPPEHIDSERLAYLAQGVIAGGKLNSIGSRVIAAVRRFIQKALKKLGIESAISSKDIAYLTERAAKAWASGEVQGSARSATQYSMLDTLSNPAKASAALKQGLAGAERSIKKAWSQKNPDDLVLHTMTLQTIIDRNKRIFNKFADNPLTAIERHHQGMQAVMQHWANRFEKSHDAFMQLSATERQGVMDMMLDATLQNAHPDQEYTPSLNMKWAKDKKKQLEGQLRGIDADERKARHNQTYTAEQRQRETKKAKAGLALLQKKIDFEVKRFQSYPALVKQWQALSVDQQAVYQDWKKQLNALWEKQTQALEQHIADIVRENKLDANAAQAAMDTVKGLRLQYRKQLQLGPYFPLKRYGDYVVQVRSLGEYSRYHFESEFEANEFKASIEKDDPNAKVLISKKVELLNQPKDAPGIAGKLLGALNEVQGLTDEQKRTLNAFVLDQLPDLSARKAEMRRHFVAGASGDMERSFANAMLHGGHDLGRILFGHKIQKALSHMAEQIKLQEDLVAGKYDDKPIAKEAAEQSILIDEADRVQAGRVLNAMRKQVDAMMSPNTNAVAAFMSNLAFFMFLAGSPAAGLLNLMQIAQITYPALASRFGDVKANKALLQASKDVMKATKLGRTTDGKFDVRQGIFSTSSAQHLTQDERDLLKTFELEGVTSNTQANALARTASGDGLANVGSFALKFSKVSAYLGFFFHNAELFNRQVTQLAAYRLYQSADKTTQQQLNKQGSNGTGAVDFARWITTRTHYNYGHANRALMIKGNAAKILLPMKNYSIMTTEFLLTRMKDVINKETDPEVKKLAAGELLRVMGVTALLAGAAGVGGAWMGTAALSTAVGYKFGGKAAGATALFLIAAMVLAPLMGDPDEPFDAEAMWTQFLREYLGDFGERAVNRGLVNAVTDIDLSSRIGINSLLYREASIHSDQGSDWVNQLAEQMLGANYSLAKSMADGAELMSQGEIQKGLEKWLPKFLRDVSKAGRYMSEGLTGRKGEELLASNEFNAWELVNQSIGFTPDDVTQVYDERGIIETAKVQLERRRNGLVNRYKRAVLDGKGDLDEVRREINRWNGKNPYLSIDPDDLKRTLKTTEKNRANKAEHSGVLISKQYQQQLEALGYK